MAYFHFKHKSGDARSDRLIRAVDKDDAILRMNGDQTFDKFDYRNPGCGCCSPGWEDPVEVVGEQLLLLLKGPSPMAIE